MIPARHRVILGMALSGLAASACGRTAVEQAAVRAQEACIAALEPVSKDQKPSVSDLASAVRDAEAAARVDERWAPLRDRVRELRSTLGKEAGRARLDALVEECGRVNQIVKDNRDDV